jgi:hypothetical protein
MIIPLNSSIANMEDKMVDKLSLVEDFLFQMLLPFLYNNEWIISSKASELNNKSLTTTKSCERKFVKLGIF